MNLNPTRLVSFGKTANGRVVTPGSVISAPRNSYAKPRVSIAPKITGLPNVGQVLTCDGGTWVGGPTITYKWYSGANETGFSTSTYTVEAGDVGKQIYCIVKATNVSGLSNGYMTNTITGAA